MDGCRIARGLEHLVDMLLRLHSVLCCAGTRPRQWEAQLQDVAKEHLDGRNGARGSADSADSETPYGADVTITKTKEKKQSWLGGDKSARPTGDLPNLSRPKKRVMSLLYQAYNNSLQKLSSALAFKEPSS